MQHQTHINPRNRRMSYSVIDTFKKLIFCIAIPLIIINIVITSLSIFNIKNENRDMVLNSVEIFQNNLSVKIRAVQQFIQWTVVQEPLIRTLETTDSDYECFLNITALRTRVNDHQVATGTDYQYFLYLSDQDAYYNACTMKFSWETYSEIKKYIIDFIHTNKASQYNFTWNTLTANNTNYLYYMINYYNRTFLTVISLEDLIAPLSTISLGKNGFLVISDLQNEIIYSSRPDIDLNTLHTNSLFYSFYEFSGSDYHLPFNILLYTDNFSNYGHLLLFQMFIILTSLSICVILSVFIFYLYKRVIKPIQTFTEALSNLNEYDELIDLQNNEIRELEQANLQFKNLIREIKKLKINIYEQELDKKRFQITFLQHQIRPHFYLNCLTTIGSMVQLGEFENVNSMILFTSRYLRYLFQADKELVRIEYELAHIQAYLDIQSLRYGSVFTYHCNIDTADKAALIPPLLLITFIENSTKHNNVSYEQLSITLIVKKEQLPANDMLTIDIIDTGVGFSQEILNRLSTGENLNTSTTSHIGITNSIQRLSLLYNTNYQINFFNEPEGGAHIRLSIPYQIQEEQS